MASKEAREHFIRPEAPDFSRFGPITIDQLDALPDPEWALELMLPDGEVSFLFGDPEAGKSFFAQHLAYAVATGQTLADRQVKHGPVVYFLAEGTRRTKLRKKAWEQQFGQSLGGAPITFYTIPGDWKRGGEDADALLALVEHHKPALVIIDTLTQHLFASYSDDAAAAAFIDTCQRVRQTGACVLVIHHQGKDESKGLMGSTVWRAAGRATLHAKKTGDRTTVKVQHSNDGPEGEALHFDFVTVDLGEHESAVLVPRGSGPATEAKEQPKRLPDDLELARRVLVQLSLDMQDAHDRDWFTHEEFSERIGAEDIIAELPEDERKRYEKLHKFRGRLERYGIVHWLKDKRHIVLGNRAYQSG